MSKTFGALFGKSGSQQTSSTPTGYESLSPEAQKVYTQSLQGAQGLTAQNFAPAATTPEQLKAAQYFSTPVSAVTPEQFQAGISTYTNPFEEQVLKNTINDLNTEAQGGYRDIASLASDAGGFGSNRRGLLESELQKNLLKTVGDISASSRSANFENAAGRTLADIGQVRSMNQQNMGSLFDIGTQFQANNTAAQQAPAQLQRYLADLATMLKGGGQTTQTPDYGLLGHPFVQSFAQGAGQGAGAAAASDSRLKENIKKVGNENGFNIYEWNYLDNKTKWRGVMADEVLRTRPDAIVSIKGFLHVIYDKLGLKMELVNV